MNSRLFSPYQKNGEKYFYFLITVLLLFFFSNSDFVLNCDIKLHYDFAKNIPLLFTNGLEWFSDNVKYAHVLSYPGWHCIFLAVHKLCEIGVDIGVISTEYSLILASAIVNTLFMVMTIYLTTFGLERCFQLRKRTALTISGIMTFVGPIFLPVLTNKYYLGQFTANPWHNPTTVAVEPFAVSCFFLLCYVRKNHVELEKSKINMVLAGFGLLLFISAFFKPSFYQSFVPAVIVYLVLEFFLFKNTSRILDIKCGIALLPVCILALLQYSISFISTSNGIIIKPFEVWSMFSKNILVSFVCSFFFLFTVAAFAFKNILENEEVKISILYLASAVSQFIIFSFRESAGTGDFVWGAYLATHIGFLTGMIALADHIQKRGFDIKAKVSVIVLFVHLLCGIGYFIAILLSGSFYL